MTSRILPKHIAIVMDGNGRWAQERGEQRLAGHEQGLKAVKNTIEYCAKLGINVLSLFAFSSENWSRPSHEVDFLMGLFLDALNNEVSALHEHQLCLRFIGERRAFSQELQQRMQDAEQLTANNSGMKLVIALNYGGKWDILQATRQFLQSCIDNQLKPEDITEEMFSQVLSTHGLPNPDLFIRTSGEQRISNFFLWQLAYSEMYFCKHYWPDFNETLLEEALQWFERRERRYGKTSEQLSKGDTHA